METRSTFNPADDGTAGEAASGPYAFTVLTIFPEMVREAVRHSIVGRACSVGRVSVSVVDIRDFTSDRHRTTDDMPYGGGPGMVMKVEPLAKGIRAARDAFPRCPVVLLSASGRLFDQAAGRRLALGRGLILVCGHYEGVDERVTEHYVDEELSIGDYVVSGGELPALVILDAVARLVPGVVGNRASLAEESHESGLLEYPQYTRPAEFEGHRVPDVLVSGDHAEVARYRRARAIEKTARNRPDLLERRESEAQ